VIRPLFGPVYVARTSSWRLTHNFVLHYDLTCSTANSHANLKLTKVNTYGLHYEWKGSNFGCIPEALACRCPCYDSTCQSWSQFLFHSIIDVVPVVPPYSGYFDGELLLYPDAMDTHLSLSLSGKRIWGGDTNFLD
jgi:hypothetical protein